MSYNSLKISNEHLSKVNSLKDDLSAIGYCFSHDLKKPIRAIKTELDQISDLVSSDDQIIKRFANISQALDEISLKANMIVDYIKIENARVKIKEVDLERVIRDVVYKFKESNSNEILLSLNILPELNLDHDLFYRLFYELIDNSIKFNMNQVVVIDIKSVIEGNLVVFNYSDNSILIDPIFSETIFCMFQRLYTQSEYPGNGMGLSICKKIIEKHGGQMWHNGVIAEKNNFFFTIKFQPV